MIRLRITSERERPVHIGPGPIPAQRRAHRMALSALARSADPSTDSAVHPARGGPGERSTAAREFTRHARVSVADRSDSDAPRGRCPHCREPILPGTSPSGLVFCVRGHGFKPAAVAPITSRLKGWSE